MNNLGFLEIPLPEDVRREVLLGNFEGAKSTIKRLLKKELPHGYNLRLKYEIERMRRIPKDFPWNREAALQILREEVEDFSEENLEKWISQGYIERMLIEGEERFFEKFAQNLFFLEENIRKKKKDPLNTYSKDLIRESIMRINSGDLRKYRVVAGIKVKMKKKNNYRVWLPVPKENFQIDKVKILSASPKYYLADNDVKQRTIYFEGPGDEFYVEFEYEISEVQGGIDGSANPKEYLEEKSPHVRFTSLIRKLVDNITEGVEGNYNRTKMIYRWITQNTNYTYVREYCTYDNISEFVATSLRGDCGMFALLFITLCRAAGIPAKWQSGWFVTPKFASPHDWAQVYVNGKWLPVDPSFGNAKRHGEMRNKFYFGNLDAFRMIANDDFMVDFIPEKKFWRSDPVDNQRGEVEDEKNNLYFNEFQSKIYVKEFKRVK